MIRYNLQAAMDLLLTQPDIANNGNESDHEDQSNDNNRAVIYEK